MWLRILLRQHIFEFLQNGIIVNHECVHVFGIQSQLGVFLYVF